MEKGEKITLCVKKRTPSLNTLLGMNRWASQREERNAEGGDDRHRVRIISEHVNEL